jgi:hypothetical protein
MGNMPAKITEFPHATRDAILGMDDTVRELVQVPEWKLSVWVRALTGLERDRYEGAMVAYRKNRQGTPEIDHVVVDNMRARLVSMSCVDDDGKRLFTDADVLALGAKNATPLSRICDVAQRLSRLSSADMEALKTELGEGQSADSGSD